MPLSLWGLDDARKNFNSRVDKTGSAAWNTARGRKQKPDDDYLPPPARGSTSSSTSPYRPEKPSLKPVESFPPPPRKAAIEVTPPTRTTSAGSQYTDAKSRRPPAPPLPARQPSYQTETPPLPRRTTTAVPASNSVVRPSELLNRAPSLPAAIQRNENQDGVTNELAQKLAKMRTRSTSPSETLAPTTTTKPPPLPSKPKPPPSPIPTKPTPQPRTTPAPPRIPPLKPVQSKPQPSPLPYTASPLHKSILPKFEQPRPDATCASVGLDTFNRLFQQPLWELEQASLFILATLYPSDKDYTSNPKTIDGNIALIMRDMDGNAHAENSTVVVSSGGKNQFKWRSNLVFSTRNLTEIANWKRGDAWFIGEVRGVIVHELTHSWQWSCKGMPGGLTEGTSSSWKFTYFRDCGFCEIEGGVGAESLGEVNGGDDLGYRLCYYGLFSGLCG